MKLEKSGSNEANADNKYKDFIPPKNIVHNSFNAIDKRKKNNNNDVENLGEDGTDLNNDSELVKKITLGKRNKTRLYNFVPQFTYF